MRTRQICVVAGLAMAWAVPAFAGCDIRFDVTTGGSLNGAKSIQCAGPWFRASSCLNLEPDLNQYQFYCAENTAFSPKGEWSCTVSTNDCSSFVQNVYVTEFCVTSDNTVQLSVTGAAAPTVNMPLAPCGSTSTDAVLANTGQGQPGAKDSDTYVWRGKGGGPFLVKLDRDGAGGSSLGSRARVQVLSEGGQLLAQDSGKVPLRVRGTVPASGVFRIIVSEVQQGGRPSDDALRGGYQLTVDAEGLKQDRTLEPLRDVE